MAKPRGRAPEKIRPPDCTISIQKMMASALSVRVRDLTSAIDTPKPTAAPSAIQLARIDCAGGGERSR